jgi:cytochrome c oxidase subunit 4
MLTMNVESPTRFPRLVRREVGPHQPSQFGYVKIAVFLAVITLAEVLIWQWDTRIIWLYMGILILLAATKFITVVAFFMHLRFDGRLLTYLFASGLVLALIVFFIAVVSLKAIEV